jgi:hypothetical protein
MSKQYQAAFTVATRDLLCFTSRAVSISTVKTALSYFSAVRIPLLPSIGHVGILGREQVF